MKSKKIKAFCISLLGLLAVFSFIAMLEEEEGEEYEEAPESKKALSAWWNDFEAKAAYPFYGILLYTDSDIAASDVLTNYHTELGILGGHDCCFLYFRDIRNAKQLTAFTSQEQKPWVNALINLLNIDTNELPCFIFFKDLMGEELVTITIKGMPVEQVIQQAREIFGYIRTHRTKKASLFGGKIVVDAFDALMSFHKVHRVKVTTSKVLKKVKQVGNTTVFDLIKFFLPIPLH